MNRPLVERGTGEREKRKGLSSPFPFPFLAVFFPKQRACSQAKKKKSSNPFRIRISLFLYSSFGTETILIRSYTPVAPSKTIPDSRPKWAKCIPVFRPKRLQNPTRWHGIYLYSLQHKGVPPPPLGDRANVCNQVKPFSTNVYQHIIVSKVG